jgi:hypothetical protein
MAMQRAARLARDTVDVAVAVAKTTSAKKIAAPKKQRPVVKKRKPAARPGFPLGN